MIAYLSGIPKVIGTQLIIDVHGVGYGVSAGERTMARLSGLEHVELFVYTHVREDALQLFGFLTQGEKALFLELLEVSGVGPRTALAIADQGDAVVTAIQQADVAFFTHIPRVGKKLAQKIIIELKGKIGSVRELDLTPESQHQQDVAEALRSLGCSDQDIQRVMQEVSVESLSLTDAITQGLQYLGKKS